MEIPLKKIETEKHGGKLRANVHVLGIAHRPDGSVAARFSESVALEFDDEKRLSAFLWPSRFTTRTSSKLSPARTRLTSLMKRATTAGEK